MYQFAHLFLWLRASCVDRFLKHSNNAPELTQHNNSKTPDMYLDQLRSSILCLEALRLDVAENDSATFAVVPQRTTLHVVTVQLCLEVSQTDGLFLRA